MAHLDTLLILIAICVVLPITIVWILYRASMNHENKRAQILIEAIKSRNDLNAVALVESFNKPIKTEKEIRSLRLLLGLIFSLSGIVITALSLMSIFDDGLFPLFSEILIMLGGISIAIGISYLIVYYLTGKAKADPQESQNA